MNKKENGITFEIKKGFDLELLTSETLKLLGNTKSKITKDKNGENLPYLGITEVVLTHCSISNDNYQQSLSVLYTFVPTKSFAQFLDISPNDFIFLKTFDLEFLYIEVWFTVQNFKPLYSVQLRDRIFVRVMYFLSFARNAGNNFSKNINKNLSSKYIQKLLDPDKKSASDALKTASKRTIQKAAEATDDLIVYKIADKVTRVQKPHYRII